MAMDTGRYELKEYLLWLQQQMAVILYELKFRQFMRALKAGFNNEQSRDEDGRWTDEGGESAKIAARGREAECEAQYARDTFICQSLRLRTCWERAAERLGACLGGRSIPTLRF